MESSKDNSGDKDSKDKDSDVDKEDDNDITIANRANNSVSYESF